MIPRFIRDDAGFTPLHYAVIKGRRQLITPLIKYGADWTLHDGRGKNSLQLAETYDLKKLFQGNSNFSHHSPHFPILLKSTLLIDWL
jgi:ankyrin repeat protein